MDSEQSAQNNRRIAIFARSLGGGGGVERVVIELASALASRGLTVDLVLARKKGRFVDDVPTTVNVIDLDAPPAYRLLPALWSRPRDLGSLLPAICTPGVAQVLGAAPALAKYIDRLRPDAVISALDYANVTAILARDLAEHPTRLICTVHNHLTSAAQVADRRHLKYVLNVVRRFYGKADTIVCVSDGVADDLRSILASNTDAISRIYNPVYSQRIETMSAEPSPHAWLEGDEPVILGVGKLRPQKDFTTLLRAFALLRRERPAKLIILGEGPERQKLVALCATLGLDADVAMPGFAANPYSYMARASLFVLSSRFEGFGNVLVEAMACGCPVVSTDCPSGPAEILDHGRYGRLVPVGDATGLAKVMKETLNEGSADGARERAAEFDVAAIAACYEELVFPE